MIETRVGALRVLNCIPSLLGGGAERQLGYITEGLVRQGVEVHVALLVEGPNAERVRRAGGVIHTVPHRQPWDLRAVPWITALARRLRADIVQTWLTRMDLWGGAAALRARLPWILSERNTSTGVPTAPTDRARYVLGRLASAVATNSHAAVGEWRARVGADTPVVMIPNALSARELDATPGVDRARLGVPDDAPLLLYAGRFAAPKNTDTLAAVIAEVLRARPDAWALLCGEGPDLGAARALLAEAGVLSRCVLPGYRDDLWSWMRSASVFVSMSRGEGRPNALEEALHLGVPCVVSDIVSHREVAADDAVRFVGADDRARAAHEVLALLGDRSMANDLAARGRASAVRTDPDAAAASYLALYEEVIARA